MFGLISFSDTSSSFHLYSDPHSLRVQVQQQLRQQSASFDGDEQYSRKDTLVTGSLVSCSRRAVVPRHGRRFISLSFLSAIVVRSVITRKIASFLSVLICFH